MSVVNTLNVPYITSIFNFILNPEYIHVVNNDKLSIYDRLVAALKHLNDIQVSLHCNFV